MKVIWLCGFSNSNIGKRFGFNNFKESAPWINNLISIFENHNDLELHIIAPNVYSNTTVHFKENHIWFHLFKYTPKHFNKVFNKIKFNELSSYYFQRLRIRKIVNTISPDIIHLHGAENPIYSASILDYYRNFLCFVTVQGFIFQDIRSNNFTNKVRKKFEKKILCSLTNFGVRTKDMCNILAEFNPNSTFYWHNYPITKPISFHCIDSPQYKYDCISFGRISIENGIEDFLHAISLVKRYFPNIRCALIGPVGAQYKIKLLQIINRLDLTNNIIITGYYCNQQLAFKEVSLAKINVLCTYYDIIPGTIIESMYIGTPVIAYGVGGIPELNQDRESLITVDKCDIKQLSLAIINLLKDTDYRRKLSNNAKITVNQYFDNTSIYKNLFEIYCTLTQSKKTNFTVCTDR